MFWIVICRAALVCVYMYKYMFRNLACWYSLPRTHSRTDTRTYKRIRIFSGVFAEHNRQQKWIDWSSENGAQNEVYEWKLHISRKTRAFGTTFHWKLNSLKWFSKHRLILSHSHTHTCQNRGESPLNIASSPFSSLWQCTCVLACLLCIIRARAVTQFRV